MNQNYLFFSIVVPAHNEECYISQTIGKLLVLDYPKDRYEIIVVENGSTDKTYEEAKKFEADNLTVAVSPKGVSVARNAGIKKLAKNSEWVIFLDADTLLSERFLKDLNTFLSVNLNQNYVIGTTAIEPLSKKLAARFWFTFYNLGHRLTKTSFALQIIKRPLLDKIWFDEQLVMGEDLKLITDARRYGRFFYLPTREAQTSTRRFEHEGWLKVFFHWVFVAMLPDRLQRRFGYKIVR